jgi:hypothetical protein
MGLESDQQSSLQIDQQGNIFTFFISNLTCLIASTTKKFGFGKDSDILNPIAAENNGI